MDMYRCCLLTILPLNKSGRKILCTSIWRLRAVPLTAHGFAWHGPATMAMTRPRGESRGRRFRQQQRRQLGRRRPAAGFAGRIRRVGDIAAGKRVFVCYRGIAAGKRVSGCYRDIAAGKRVSGCYRGIAAGKRVSGCYRGIAAAGQGALIRCGSNAAGEGNRARS